MTELEAEQLAREINARCRVAIGERLAAERTEVERLRAANRRLAQGRGGWGDRG